MIIFIFFFFFFSSRRRHTRYIGDWSSDVCSSDLTGDYRNFKELRARKTFAFNRYGRDNGSTIGDTLLVSRDRKSTRLNSSHRCISYAVFCLKKKKKTSKSAV